MDGDKENPLAVSQYLIQCFKGVIDTNAVSKKATILTMIAKNLTYDDPGMFIKFLACDEPNLIIQNATLCWLIHQVIWLSNEREFYSSATHTEALTHLQKTILSASFLKQPKLCGHLISKYIEFTNQLTNVTVQTSKPLEVTLFQVDNFDMTTIDENGTFQPIKITSAQAQNKILMSNVRILSHIGRLMINLEKELTVQCTQCLLNAFINGPLRVKLKCLRFFTDMLKPTLKLDDRLQPLLSHILEGIHEVGDRLPLWIHHKLVKANEIDELVRAVNSFLSSQYIGQLFSATSLYVAVMVCLKMIETHNKMPVQIYENIIPFVYEFVKTTAAVVGDDALYNKIFDLVKTTLNNRNESKDTHLSIELLGIVALDEMKMGKLECWCLIDKMISEMMQQSNSTAQCIIEQMKCLQSIFNAAQCLEHNLTMCLQRNICNKNPVLENDIQIGENLRKVFTAFMMKRARPLFPNIVAIGKFVLQQFSQLLTTKYNPLVDTSTLLLFADLTITLLSIYDSQEIDDYLQSNLLLISLCPFIRCSELLFNHFQQAFERETQRINNIMESPFLRDNSTTVWQLSALQSIIKLNLEYISNKNKDIFMDFLGQIFSAIKRTEFLDEICNMLVNCVIQVNTYGIQDYEKFLTTIAISPENHFVVAHHLSNFYCVAAGGAHIFQKISKNDRIQNKIICQTCKIHFQSAPGEVNFFSNLLDKTNGKYVKTLKKSYKIHEQSHLKYFELFASEKKEIRSKMTFVLPSMLNHLDMGKFHENIDYCLNLLVDNETEIRFEMAKHISIFPKRCDAIVLHRCQTKLLECTQKFLCSDQKSDQEYAIQLLLSFATADGITENMLLNCFRMIIYYCMSSMSLVSRQAALCATEMCFKFGITPKNLLVWYKTDILKLIVTLCTANYASFGIGLQKSTNAMSQLFGYSDEKQFITEHYGTILATLIPWSMKNKKCIGLIDEICDIIQKDVASTLSSSFLTIYSHLYLQETAEINNKGMDFILSKTDNSLYHLLKSDTKQTIAEVLIYYHMNPEFVMKTFRCLLDDAPGLSQMDFSTKKLVEHLKSRFLGVICHFEQILIGDNEKSLKREILLSIGEIMRVMGSEIITQFRFKLLAVLRAALSINQIDLKDICAKIWKIFIKTVDLLELGPLLSTIFVSLEPLLKTHQMAVNEILKYLIIDNGNLLSAHISDLFFVQHLNVSADIKMHCQRYTDKMGTSFIDKFTASMRYINHDNLTVRIYGLNYLTELFDDNRKALNQLIIGQQKMHSIIENLIDTLIICIKSNDAGLQTAAGRCLGKLAAIEPSHLSQNYRPQESFARSIDTDEFAISALTELCSAYQSQKDTKNVDVYSLAIQEILVARKVCPAKNENLRVWEAIPDRMKSLVEPLLTSCYVVTQSLSRIRIHPVFGSYKCNTYEDWAITWATKTIEAISNESIKTLLRSFRPSMRIDMSILTMALPYIILHAIQTNDASVSKEIEEEFYAVTEFVINPTNKCDTDVNRTRFKSVKGLDFAISRNDSDAGPKNETIDIIAIKCAKLMFHQLDFIERWLRSTNSSDIHYAAVNKFIGQFNKKLLASANYSCGEYARALLYLEAYIEEEKDDARRKIRCQTELSFLFQIYAELMDPDSLEGALNLKDTEPTLAEQILRNNVQGRLQESTVCFERMMHVNGMIENNTKDMIQCYLGLDQPETALLLAEGLMRELYDQNNEVLLQSSAEPLWRLGRFEELEDLIETSNLTESSEWGIRCGQILLDFRKDDKQLFEMEVNKSRLMILKDLRIVGDEQNCYHKGYSNVMKLHLICEIEQAYCTVVKMLEGGLNQINSQEALKKLFQDWDERLQLLQPAARIIEPVLCLRRIVLNEAKNLLKAGTQNQNIFNALERKINDYIGASWIKSIELAREDGMHQQADLYILNAEPYKPKTLFIEKAKLLWKKLDQTNSFKVLERGIEEIKSSGTERTLSDIDKSTLGEAKFLIAFYNAESLNINTELNMRYFEKAFNALKESEKILVHYAQYVDKTLAAMPQKTGNDEYDSKSYDQQMQIVLLYFKSMLFGTKYIYQSMPRVLSIWFDFTAIDASELKNKKQEEHFRKTSARMNEVSKKFSEKLPAFIFFTAFSQLVSRICHPSPDVYNTLKSILIKLIMKFPHQSLWMILSVYKSSYANRVRRCTEVLSDKRLQTRELPKLIQDFNSLAEKMIELTNKELPQKISKFSVSQIYPQLPALLSKAGFSNVLLPIQKYMQPVLPALHQQNDTFNAFPDRVVHITGMKDELTVLASLQRPRRVTFCGSDGNNYIFMMKPKDDLRKDFRLMEFNSVVKKYLHENSEARQRRLNIRTYAVVPLNEECGILEWVSNLQAFRHIVNGYYKQRKMGITSAEIKEAQQVSRANIEKKRDFFRRTLIKCPPIFSYWFRERFTTPYNWYQARNSYVRTTAVMSIVGYILGLGDRHGENILFDANSGDTVHVDFNCLFNKGESFEVPEVVPFRLTQNMVHAMGPLGIEGPYRKCCEITLKVLQDQSPTLMSVLRPFVYDPLVGWSRQSKSDGRSERTDAQAMKNVQHIEERLKGYIKINGTKSNMPLSTEGVVNHCILEASDFDKLASMYIGWGAYL